MNKLACCFLILGFLFPMANSVFSEPEALTEPDRIALLEKFEAIQKRSDDRVGGLYSRAIRDFKRAVSSDDATMDLYLKCYKKVRFEDQHKKSQEFRKWKRSNKNRLKSASMRMALRHQLSWLLLSIEAAKMDGDVSPLGNKAKNHIDQIIKHAKILKDYQGILRQNALSSIFAQAYKLHIKVKDWPSSALDIERVYDKLVLPPLREAKNAAAMRSAWTERISQQKHLLEVWTQKDQKRIGTKKSMESPESEKFTSETLPKLLWEMEVDCFKAGDERVAALKMLKYLESNMTHKEAPNWMKQFEELITNPRRNNGKAE